jgi:hypothetical protein
MFLLPIFFHFRRFKFSLSVTKMLKSSKVYHLMLTLSNRPYRLVSSTHNTKRNFVFDFKTELKIRSHFQSYFSLNSH